MASRLPRFRRASEITSMLLTERDREIIRFVHRHRFLRSSQITSLVGGNGQQILRRLKLLYHHRYLERPRAQIDYYHRGGSRHIVYGLGSRGAALLKEECGDVCRPDDWGEKNRAVGRIFLEHALLVSDVMVAFELSCREKGIRLLAERELARSRKHQLFRWRVNLRNRVRLGIVPDRVFALEIRDSNGNARRAHFFLEADRGTMPVIRKHLSQTSFYRKLLAYEATWLQSVHRRRFGFDRFRVLGVTTSAARTASLIGACSKLKRGRGLFLFTERAALENPGDVFSSIWKSGEGGNPASIHPH